MGPDSEIGRLALEKGLITGQQLEDARRESADRAGGPDVLVNVLLDKGYLCSADVAELRRERETPPPTDPVLDADTPEEVRRAAKFNDSRFGKYIIVKLIGTGGMGSVYKAWDAGLQRMIALKFLTSGSDENIRRFIREARTAAQLNHPWIAQVYDAGSHEDRHFIAMEYVDGVTLDELPESIRKDPGRVLLKIFRDIAKALDYAHQKGIVHRDLKPQNIMVDAAMIPHIMDFGLARPVETGQEDLDKLISHQRKQITLAGTVIGTPNYVPPEQARGDPELIDARSDIYSLGATLYAIITGIPPHSGPTPIDTLLAVLQEEPVAPSKLVPLPRDLETVLMKMLEKEKHLRYSRVGEVAEEFERILAGEPILARPLGSVRRIRRFIHRHPVLCAWIASSLLFTAMGIFFVDRFTRAMAPPPGPGVDFQRTKFLEALQSRDRGFKLLQTVEVRFSETTLEAARKDFLSALAVADFAPDARRGLARVALLLGDETDAEQNINRALELRPDFPEARFLRALIMISGAWRAAAPGCFFRREFDWLGQPNLDVATTDLHQLSPEEYPQAAGYLALVKGNFAEAVEALRASGQGNWDALWALALAEAGAGAWKDCESRTVNILAGKRSVQPAHLLRGLARLAQGLEPLPVPDALEGWEFKVLRVRNSGDMDSAVKLSDEAPEDPVALALRGELRLAASDAAGADDLRKAAEIWPALGPAIEKILKNSGK